MYLFSLNFVIFVDVDVQEARVPDGRLLHGGSQQRQVQGRHQEHNSCTILIRRALSIQENSR